MRKIRLNESQAVVCDDETMHALAKEQAEFNHVMTWALDKITDLQIEARKQEEESEALMAEQNNLCFDRGYIKGRRDAMLMSRDNDVAFVEGLFQMLMVAERSAPRGEITRFVRDVLEDYYLRAERIMKDHHKRAPKVRHDMRLASMERLVLERDMDEAYDLELRELERIDDERSDDPYHAHFSHPDTI